MNRLTSNTRCKNGLFFKIILKKNYIREKLLRLNITTLLMAVFHCSIALLTDVIKNQKTYIPITIQNAGFSGN